MERAKHFSPRVELACPPACEWTDSEVRDWAAWVKPPKEPNSLSTIRDLLFHANGDGMTQADRDICLRALWLLDPRYVSRYELRLKFAKATKH